MPPNGAAVRFINLQTLKRVISLVKNSVVGSMASVSRLSPEGGWDTARRGRFPAQGHSQDSERRDVG